MEITSLNWLTSPYTTYDTVKNYFTKVLGEGSLSDRIVAFFKKIVISDEVTPNKEDPIEEPFDEVLHLEISVLNNSQKENESTADKEGIVEENRLVNIYKSVFGTSSLQDRIILVSKGIFLLGSLYVILKYGIIDPIIAYQSDRRKISSCSLSFESAVSSLSEQKKSVDNSIESFVKSYFPWGILYSSEVYKSNAHFAWLANGYLSFYQSQITSYNEVYDQCQKTANPPGLLCRSLSSCSLSAEKLLREINAYDDYRNTPSNFVWSKLSSFNFTLPFEELGFKIDCDPQEHESKRVRLKKIKDYFYQSSQWQSIKDRIYKAHGQNENVIQAKRIWGLVPSGHGANTSMFYKMLKEEKRGVLIEGEADTKFKYQDDPYVTLLAIKILEVYYGASASEIKKAYRQLSKLVHPDQLNKKCSKEQQGEPYCGDAPFRAISAAYEFLTAKN